MEFTSCHVMWTELTHIIEFFPEFKNLVHVDIDRQIIVRNSLLRLHQPLGNHLDSTAAKRQAGNRAVWVTKALTYAENIKWIRGLWTHSADVADGAVSEDSCRHSSKSRGGWRAGCGCSRGRSSSWCLAVSNRIFCKRMSRKYEKENKNDFFTFIFTTIQIQYTIYVFFAPNNFYRLAFSKLIWREF